MKGRRPQTDKTVNNMNKQRMYQINAKAKTVGLPDAFLGSGIKPVHPMPGHEPGENGCGKQNDHRAEILAPHIGVKAGAFRENKD